MNILKGVAETFLGRESESFEEKVEKFERLEKSENKQTIETDRSKSTIFKEEIIQQVIKPLTKTEVQPIVNLEREQTEVHEIIQPIKEKEILPTTTEERELPLIEKEDLRESEENFKEEYSKLISGFQSTVTVDKLQKRKEIKRPIVNEKIHKKVIEEIQPVIRKETIAPHLVKETQLVHERIVEAPKLFQEDYSQRPNLEKLKAEGVEVDSFTKKPITEETIKPIRTQEIQPIVQLEREQTELHEVIQSIHKREVLPTTMEETNLPTIEREEVRESEEEFKKEYEALSEQLRSSVKVEDVEHQKVVKAPIINEILHRKVIEEIQPVIHKETLVPHLIRETLPVHEKLIEAPRLFVEELPEKDLGVTYIQEPTGLDRTVLEHKKVA